MVNSDQRDEPLTSIIQTLESRDTNLLLQIQTLQEKIQSLEIKNSVLETENAILSKEKQSVKIQLTARNRYLNAQVEGLRLNLNIWKKRFKELEEKFLLLEEASDRMSKQNETNGESDDNCVGENAASVQKTEGGSGKELLKTETVSRKRKLSFSPSMAEHLRRRERRKIRKLSQHKKEAGLHSPSSSSSGSS